MQTAESDADVDDSPKDDRFQTRKPHPMSRPARALLETGAAIRIQAAYKSYKERRSPHSSPKQQQAPHDTDRASLQRKIEGQEYTIESLNELLDQANKQIKVLLEEKTMVRIEAAQLKEENDNLQERMELHHVEIEDQFEHLCQDLTETKMQFTYQNVQLSNQVAEYNSVLVAMRTRLAAMGQLVRPFGRLSYEILCAFATSGRGVAKRSLIRSAWRW